MFDSFRKLKLLWAALLVAIPVLAAAEPTLESGTVMEVAARLKAGEYMWAPDVAPEGAVLLVVSLARQRAVLYRNGLPIAISTVSSGRPGHATPTGIFTVLQRRVEHYSNLYNNAPMPYMQRLTWDGIAMHAGKLPGYPASHG
jgi:lipoprotein-anchoring transpeptidase ErfK/SrfK